MYSCKYTWIIMRIPLARCKMKWISTAIAKSLYIITMSLIMFYKEHILVYQYHLYFHNIARKYTDDHTV